MNTRKYYYESKRIERKVFELAWYNIAVKHVSHDTQVLLPALSKIWIKEFENIRAVGKVKYC